MMSKTRCPEPGEIWMGNFDIVSEYTPMLLSYNRAHKNIIMIISNIAKLRSRARFNREPGWFRTKRLIALGLCEGKIVGIEMNDREHPYIGLTRVA